MPVTWLPIVRSELCCFHRCALYVIGFLCVARFVVNLLLGTLFTPSCGDYYRYRKTVYGFYELTLSILYFFNSFFLLAGVVSLYKCLITQKGNADLFVLAALSTAFLVLIQFLMNFFVIYFNAVQLSHCRLNIAVLIANSIEMAVMLEAAFCANTLGIDYYEISLYGHVPYRPHSPDYSFYAHTREDENNTN